MAINYQEIKAALETIYFFNKKENYIKGKGFNLFDVDIASDLIFNDVKKWNKHQKNDSLVLFCKYRKQHNESVDTLSILRKIRQIEKKEIRLNRELAIITFQPNSIIAKEVAKLDGIFDDILRCWIVIIDGEVKLEQIHAFANEYFFDLDDKNPYRFFNRNGTIYLNDGAYKTLIFQFYYKPELLKELKTINLKRTFSYGSKVWTINLSKQNKLTPEIFEQIENLAIKFKLDLDPKIELLLNGKGY